MIICHVCVVQIEALFLYVYTYTLKNRNSVYRCIIRTEDDAVRRKVTHSFSNAVRHGVPLLTLDGGMKEVAHRLGIPLVE